MTDTGCGGLAGTCTTVAPGGAGAATAGCGSDAAAGNGASIAKLSSVRCSNAGRVATFRNANAPNSPAVAAPAASADPIRRTLAGPIRRRPRR